MLGQARGIRNSSLRPRVLDRDPEQGKIFAYFSLAVPAEQSDESKRKARGSARAMRDAAMNLSESRHRQAAAKKVIERVNARSQPFCRWHTGMAQYHAAFLLGGFEKLRQPSFDLRNFVAQGTNSLLRHGGPRHVDCSSSYVLVMFY